MTLSKWLPFKWTSCLINIISIKTSTSHWDEPHSHQWCNSSYLWAPSLACSRTSLKSPLKLSLANIFIQTLSLDSPYFSSSYKQSHLGFFPDPGTKLANFSFLECLLVTHSVHFLLPLPEYPFPSPHNWSVAKASLLPCSRWCLIRERYFHHVQVFEPRQRKEKATSHLHPASAGTRGASSSTWAVGTVVQSAWCQLCFATGELCWQEAALSVSVTFVPAAYSLGRKHAFQKRIL